MANNIYIFTNSYHPVLGGIQTVTSQLAHDFITSGYHTTVITCLYPKKLRIKETVDGVKVWRLPFVTPNGLTNMILSLITDIFLFLIFLLKRPLAVYVHFPLEQSNYIRRLQSIFKYKIITCFHGHDVLRYYDGDNKDNRIYRAQKKLIDSSFAVTACSKYLAKAVDNVFKIDTTISIYNGIDINRFRKNDSTSINTRSPYLFAFGRLEKIKGYDILISAFAKANIPENYNLLIAGEGTMRNSLQDQITRLNMRDRVKLVGRLTPESIVKYSSEAFFNIIPSLREPFGIVALEAIAAKRPVIASNTGGMPEIMSKEFGILCNPDEEDLKTAIEYVFKNIDMFNFSKADKYLCQFSIKNMSMQYLKIAKISSIKR